MNSENNRNNENLEINLVNTNVIGTEMKLKFTNHTEN